MAAPVPGPSGNPSRQAVNYRGAVIPGGNRKGGRRGPRRSGRK